MTRRNATTTFMVVAAGLLLYSGVALAREQQTGDNQLDQLVASPSPAAIDDRGGATASPEPSFDDNGGAISSAAPTASAASIASAAPTASAAPSFDDHGGNGGNGGNGADDMVAPTASAAPISSAAPSFDDHGGSSH